MFRAIAAVSASPTTQCYKVFDFSHIRERLGDARAREKWWSGGERGRTLGDERAQEVLHDRRLGQVRDELIIARAYEVAVGLLEQVVAKDAAQRLVGAHVLQQPLIRRRHARGRVQHASRVVSQQQGCRERRSQARAWKSALVLLLQLVKSRANLSHDCAACALPYNYI